MSLLEKITDLNDLVLQGKALEAFGRNGFFVLVGDKQAVSLDEEFEVKVDTEVSFVKLVPLVGG